MDLTDLLDHGIQPYAFVVRSLIYVTLCTRPDICFVMGAVNQILD